MTNKETWRFEPSDGADFDREVSNRDINLSPSAKYVLVDRKIPHSVGDIYVPLSKFEELEKENVCLKNQLKQAVAVIEAMKQKA